MRFPKTILLCIGLPFVLVLPSLGQSPTLAATPSPTATANLSEEVRILQAEAKNQQYYNDKIVGSFATLIQTAVGVFALLGGISLASAIRLRQSERKQLRTELDARHIQTLADYDSQNKALQAAFDKRLEEVGKLALSNVDDALRKTSGDIALLKHRLISSDAHAALTAKDLGKALERLSVAVGIANDVGLVSVVQTDLRMMLQILESNRSLPIKMTADTYKRLLEKIGALPPQVINTQGRVIAELNKAIDTSGQQPNATGDSDA